MDFASLFQIFLSILAFGLLIAWHELGHFLTARAMGMQVLRYSIGFGPKLFSFQKGETEYALSVIPFGGFVEIAGMSELEDDAKSNPRAFINRPRWAQFLVIAAGPLSNYLLAFILFWGIFAAWSGNESEAKLIVNQVQKDSAAQAAGLQKGDGITRINGEEIQDLQMFLDHIQKSGGNSLTLSLEEGRDLQITPKADADGHFRIGVGFLPMALQNSSPILGSLDQLWSQSTGVLRQLGQAIFGQASGVQLGGVVEITRQLSSAAEQGMMSFLWLLASLSVVLGLFNILPIPALDGSKLFIILIESIIRRPIPTQIQVWIHVVGIVFILALMLLLTVFDVLRIYQSG